MFRRFFRDSSGVSAVEFALLAVPFFMMLFGLMEGGRLLWTQVGLQHAVEMAARCASINDTALCPNVPAYAATQAYGLQLPATVFTVSSGTCGGTQVSANYQFNVFTSYLGFTRLNLSAQSCVPNI